MSLRAARVLLSLRHNSATMVGVAQLVRAPGCGPGCRGFESPRSPHGLPTELPVSYRQNCGGDLILVWRRALTPALIVVRAWLGVPAGLLRVLRAGLRRG